MRYNNEPIHTIKLYGVMRQKFGKEIKLSGHSAAATIRGFALQNKEFGDALVQGFFRVLRGEKLKSAIPYAENEIGAEIGSQSQTFHLIPVPAGSKKGGLFGVIAGVFIMAAAIICAPWTGGASLAVGVASGGEFAVGAAAAGLTAGGMSFGAAMGATAFMGISYGSIALFGLGLTLMGVAQMTAKAPDTSINEAEGNESAVISGPQNTAQQGVPVPLVYGKTMTGSIVIASNLTAVDYSHQNKLTESGFVDTTVYGKTRVKFTKKFAQVDDFILKELTSTNSTLYSEFYPDNSDPTGFDVWATKKSTEDSTEEYQRTKLSWIATGRAHDKEDD